MLSVIMAGGVGERFWPQSRRKRPKQILDLTGKGSMIRLTVERLEGLSRPEEIFIITNVEQQALISREVAGTVAPENVICEPVGRNTAPCIGLAAVVLRKKYGDCPMLVLPADHLIERVGRFQSLARAAAAYVTDHGGLLTFGMQPTRPETGYGYIEAAERVFNKDDVEIYRAAAFLEKPTLERAVKFLEGGRHYWNSGMFMWTTETILDGISRHLPDLFSLLTQIEAGIGTRPLPEVLKALYQKAPPISIDYGVMEKAGDVVVMKADFSWNDVGSWEFLRDIRAADANGNVSVGEHVFVDASNNTVVSSDRTVGLLGVDNIVVVDGGDTILVCRRDKAQEVKKIVKTLKERNRIDLI